MLGWLVPKEGKFFTYFDEHAALICKGAEMLDTIFTEAISIEQGALAIQKYEHEADFVTQSCIEDLHKTFITPIERDQIFLLISKMDDILDALESVSGQLLLYQIVLLRKEGKAFSELIRNATSEIAAALLLLRNMKNFQKIRQHCFLIRQFEKEADVVLRHALSNLFIQAEDTALIIKWKGIFEDLERASDSCQHVANIIEGVILEYS